MAFTTTVMPTSFKVEILKGVHNFSTGSGQTFKLALYNNSASFTAATQAAWQTSTSADTSVYVRVAVGTATLTAGQFIVTVSYVQRASNGAQNPASA